MASITTAQGIKWLKDSASSDFCILVDSSVFSVHKAVFRLKSEFFARCIDGSFQEANKDAVDIKEASPFAVALLVVYIYTNTLDFKILLDIWPIFSKDIRGATDQQKELFKVYMELYQIGDRFMIDDMISFVSDRIVNLASPHVKTTNSKIGLEIMRTVYDTISHTAKLRVALTVMFVDHKKKGYAVAKEMEQLVAKHEPAAWGVGGFATK